MGQRGFENTTFNDTAGIGIPKLLMNIMSCHGFTKDNNTTVILTCRSKLVSYHLSKEFLIPENNSDALIDVPKRVNQQISAEDLHPNYDVMACNRAIPFAANNLKDIHLSSYL